MSFNPLLKTAFRSALGQQARFQSTKAEVSTTFLTMGKNRDLKKIWLGDTAVYPLLAALSCAGFLCVGVGLSCLTSSPDVRIATDKKHAVIRDWGMR